ncbi:hypothetical protein TRVL_01839 [Trypanosoma vivax]|nr:hypothetical protein TRVL_01839 [Trypanosoma vivax]
MRESVSRRSHAPSRNDPKALHCFAIPPVTPVALPSLLSSVPAPLSFPCALTLVIRTMPMSKRVRVASFLCSPSVSTLPAPHCDPFPEIAVVMARLLNCVSGSVTFVLSRTHPSCSFRLGSWVTPTVASFLLPFSTTFHERLVCLFMCSGKFLSTFDLCRFSSARLVAKTTNVENR